MDWLSSVEANQVIATVIYAVIGVALFAVSFVVLEKITPFSLRKEIEQDHNTALGVILGSFLIGLAIIIAAAIV